MKLSLLETYETIKEYYGKSTYCPDYPKLVVFHCEDSAYGYQEPGYIYINLVASEEEIIGTLIHEYQHYLQDPDDWSYDYEEEPTIRATEDLDVFMGLSSIG